MAKKVRIDKQMKEAAAFLKEFMQEHLGNIAESYIKQVMADVKRLPASKRLNAIKDLKPVGIQAYKQDLKDALILVAGDAWKSVHKEIPKLKKKIKFSWKDENPNLIFEKLPTSIQNKINAQNELIIGKQVSDLQSVIQFAFAHNQDTTDSDDIIEADLEDSALEWLTGTALEAGSNLTTSSLINDVRSAFFQDEDSLDQLDALQFLNGDPVTEICQDLDGTVFAADDPEAARYTPPLHWNCKSYIVPVLKGNLAAALKSAGQDDIEKLKPSKSRLEDQIQFHEHHRPDQESAEYFNIAKQSSGDFISVYGKQILSMIDSAKNAKT